MKIGKLFNLSTISIYYQLLIIVPASVYEIIKGNLDMNTALSMLFTTVLLVILLYFITKGKYWAFLTLFIFEILLFIQVSISSGTIIHGYNFLNIALTGGGFLSLILSNKKIKMEFPNIPSNKE